jgi:hypothetical protein
MKLGQMFGYNSTQPLEEGPAPRIGTAAFNKLQQASTEISYFLSRQIDRSRFIWLDQPEQATELALRYAKNWTCSILANSNAETAYRNLRKTRQEKTIADFLARSGYVPSNFTSTLNSPNDLEIGTFCKEIRVKGRTVQKADLVFRCRGNGKLCLIEAKAVGVLLDAAKRVKECCNKAEEWISAENLGQCAVFAVIAGFFAEQHIQALASSNIITVWEHRITELLGQSACLHT